MIERKQSSTGGVQRNRREIGKQAEQQAEQHLTRIGWTIVERNWRCRQGELDLIARDGEWWVFIEVRSRTEGGSFGTAREAIDMRKQQQVRAIVEQYIHRHRLYEAKIRCDAIIITYTRRGDALPELEHIAHAF
ncbi:YraN family protein [Paenibacillus sp. SC116]|uniref:YraN family protein n=1 Tax=Paenibacillus sp. SC116 TaxID=2968986 RepID=UPI00215AB29D|nr:YraN family protein [Paenibacillus sp. SC116]MCR8845433.1 YraN family protein [Paenibacillus sp. SC116]